MLTHIEIHALFELLWNPSCEADGLASTSWEEKRFFREGSRSTGLLRSLPALALATSVTLPGTYSAITVARDWSGHHRVLGSRWPVAPVPPPRSCTSRVSPRPCLASGEGAGGGSSSISCFSQLSFQQRHFVPLTLMTKGAFSPRASAQAASHGFLCLREPAVNHSPKLHRMQPLVNVQASSSGRPGSASSSVPYWL